MLCATFVHVRYGDQVGSAWTLPRLSPLDSKRKTATKGNRKVPWSSRRLSSLFPLGSTTFPCLRSSVVDSSASPAMRIPRPTIDRSIPARDRSDIHVFAENSGQSSSTAHHNFRLARSILLQKNHTSSSQITFRCFLRLFLSSFHLFFCCCCCYSCWLRYFF